MCNCNDREHEKLDMYEEHGDLVIIWICRLCGTKWKEKR